MTAATDAIGAYHFIGSVYESPLPTIIVYLVYSKITALPVRFRQRGFSHSMDLRDSAMEMRSILRMRHRHTATASSSVAAKASA